jgi:hypothetical protein
MELKTMYGIATMVLMMAALMAAQRKCSGCKKPGHTAPNCPNRIVQVAAQMNEEHQWDSDIEAWVRDRKQSLPLADGVTIYPEKMSLQPGKRDRLKGLEMVLIGRAQAFRNRGFHLPESEIWAVLPEAMVAICVSDGRGHTFTEAKGLVQGLLAWAHEVDAFSVQQTLSNEAGYMVLQKVFTEHTPIDLWYGRPKRTGHRYVVSGAREDVE